MQNAVRIARRAMKQAVGVVDLLFMRACATTRVTSSIYYLFHRGFSREHQSVLAGILTYRKSLSNPETNTSLLRRNIHRLEKGLLMCPRRVPFALDYIGETVHAYAIAAECRTEPTELAWARDVLQEYMRITPPHPTVEPLRKIVEDATIAGIFSREEESGSRIPKPRAGQEVPRIDYDDFLRLARFRRSVRWYLPRKVSRQVIEMAIEVAAYSPTACNRQPYEFRVFDQPELVEQVLQFPMGTVGFSHQVPAVAVIVGKLRNFFSERDRHLIYVDGSLAIMSFVYALEVQGLSSCCINWPDVEDRERKMARFLKLAPDERPIMLVAFGYPDPSGLVANSTKKPVSTLCKYNFEKP